MKPSACLQNYDMDSNTKNTKIQELLNKIQQELEVPKEQKNEFGGYKYRSAEDILNAVKPLLGKAVLTIADDLVLIGDRYYVKATAKLQNGDEAVFTTAFAREEETKKGMDSSQITGSASSYARKYALNGLFCIDDTKDADTMDNREQLAQENKLTVNEENQLHDDRGKLIKQMYAIWYSLGYTKTTIPKKRDETCQKYGVGSVDSMTIDQIKNEIVSLKKVQAAKDFAEKDSTINF